LSIIKHDTLQKIVAHDFRYDLRMFQNNFTNCKIHIILPVVFYGCETWSLTLGRNVG